MKIPGSDSPPPSLSGRLIGAPLRDGPGAPLPFRQLLYRYWFFGWLFRDVNRPGLFEQAAAWRHNQEQTRWLPTYLRRWAVYSAICLALAVVVEHGFSAQAFSAVFYVQAILGITVNAVTSALLLGLKLLPAPF
jgi:hypothetical protein